MSNSRTIKFSFYGVSDIGRLRKNNEDTNIAERLSEGSPWLLAAAIDGVGGYEGGEVASAILRDSMISRIGLLSPDTLADEPLRSLSDALTAANNDVVKAKEHDSRLEDMGAVATTALFSDWRREAYIAHVGDSRAYLYADNELMKLTHDHSPVGKLEDAGMLSESEAMAHPRRNVIDRMLGENLHKPGDPDFIESLTVAFSLPAVFLFCSDGLTDLVPSAFISSVLSDSGLSPEEMASKLVAEANKIKGKDNITVVIVRCEADNGAGGEASNEPLDIITEPGLHVVSNPVEDILSSGETEMESGHSEPPAEVHSDDSSDKRTEGTTEANDNDEESGEEGRRQDSEPVRKDYGIWAWIAGIIGALILGFAIGYANGRHYGEVLAEQRAQQMLTDTLEVMMQSAIPTIRDSVASATINPQTPTESHE